LLIFFFKITEDERFAHRELALPHVTQVGFSMIRAMPHCVTVSHAVVPADDLYSQREFYVVNNHYDGISQFEISNIDAALAAGGLPWDTGRAMAVDQVPLVGDAALNAMYAKRTARVAWEGSRTVHPDLHVKAFRPVDASFRKAMKSFGWDAENHVQQLLPIVGKIHDPLLK
jgi:hypothetical protein